jgi:hypothetical protein
MRENTKVSHDSRLSNNNINWSKDDSYVLIYSKKKTREKKVLSRHEESKNKIFSIYILLYNYIS